MILSLLPRVLMHIWNLHISTIPAFPPYILVLKEALHLSFRPLGAISIVCIIIATVLGGFLIWKFRPRIKVVLGGMIATETMLCIGYLILMIPRCQTSEMLHFGMNEEG